MKLEVRPLMKIKNTYVQTHTVLKEYGQKAIYQTD